MLRRADGSTGSRRTCTSNMRSNHSTASRKPAPAAVTTSIATESRAPVAEPVRDPHGGRRRRCNRTGCRTAMHRGVMGLELEGAVVVVTGSAGGIGAALVEGFTRAGAEAVGTDLLGRGADMDLDVTDLEATRRVFGEVRAT